MPQNVWTAEEVRKRDICFRANDIVAVSLQDNYSTATVEDRQAVEFIADQNYFLTHAALSLSAYLSDGGATVTISPTLQIQLQKDNSPFGAGSGSTAQNVLAALYARLKPLNGEVLNMSQDFTLHPYGFYIPKGTPIVLRELLVPNGPTGAGAGLYVNVNATVLLMPTYI